MQDLQAATIEFFKRVDRHTPAESKRVRTVLNDLLQWTEEHSWGLSFIDRNPKGPIRCCAKGVVSPFWIFAPHTADGARLTLMTASDLKYPEELRDEARQVLAQLDGRKPEPHEVPMVGYLKLLWPPNRAILFDLMSRAINRVHGRPTEAEIA
jgi:hypothetical protein